MADMKAVAPAVPMDEPGVEAMKRDRSSYMSKEQEKVKRWYHCTCSRKCWKDSLLIAACYLCLYTFNVFYLWLLIEAFRKDTLGSLITFSVVFIVAVFIILGLIIFGQSLNLRQKAAFSTLNINMNENVVGVETQA